MRVMIVVLLHAGKLVRKDDGGDPLANTAVFAIKHD